MVVPSNARELRENEIRLPTRLLSHPFPGSSELTLQLDGLLAVELDQEGSLALFPTCEVIAPVTMDNPVEGQAADSDGVIIHFVVFVRRGRLDELELFREDNEPIKNLPPAERITVY